MMFNSRRFFSQHSVAAWSWLPQPAFWPSRTQPHPLRPSRPQPAAEPGSGRPDPLKRQRSDKERYKAQKALRQELKGAYKTWLNEEVPYIITDEERKAFMSLSNDEERDAFIEKFWLRRNPNPDSPENEFREEHYRRIAYANEHFAAGKPGWKTDRGHIYIACGAARSDRLPSLGRHVRAAHGRGRRRDLDLPVRDLALPLS